MLQGGIINPELVAGLARLGHTDTLVIADAGLPIPSDVPLVDLTLVYGSPRFEDVMRAIMDEIVVEGAVMAHEARGGQAETWVKGLTSVPISYVPHDGENGLKAHVRDASLVVRTGEATPYANVILRSGVPF